MTSEDVPRFCGSCGTPLVEGAHFCAACGWHVPDASAAPPPGAPAGATPPPSGAVPPPPPPPPPPPGPVPPPPGAVPPPGAPPPAYVPPGPPPGAPPAYAPAAYAPPAPGGPPAGSGGPPGWLVPVLGVALVLVLIGAGAVFLVGRDGDGGGDEGEIFLEAAATIGDDPFGSRSYESAVVPVPTSSTTASPPTSEGGTTALRAVAGDAVGLYGGTQDQSRCDVDQMRAFLQANQSQGGAFVEALNADPTLRWSGGNRVAVGQIGDYLDELTPVTLTRDTRVTNHGYRDGRPRPKQSVLQAGTAVLVDRYGVPRARCACGNPLIPPRRATASPRYTGPRWDGFDPANVVVVSEVNVEITTFVIVDLTTGELIRRPAGTTGDEDVPDGPSDVPDDPGEPAPPSTDVPLGTGDVQITLTWTGDLDLDLHVTDPNGTEIYYGNKTSPSGGELDVDRIPSAGEGGPHVENVYWPSGGAPAGGYTVFVRALSGGNDTASAFTLDVFLDGERVTGTSGTLTESTTSETVPFVY